MPIILPTKPTPATLTDPKTLLIYGPPKVGKTYELAQLPDTLILDLERGSRYTSGLKMEIENVIHFIEVLETIYKTKPRPYKRIAIDTVDQLESWCEETATEVYKESTIGKSFKGKSVLELPNGGGYRWLRHEFKRYFTMVQQACEQVIFVAHIRDKFLVKGDSVYDDKTKSFKAVDDQQVSHTDIDLTGKCRSIACSESDAIGHMFRDRTNALFISFKGNETVTCGSRCDHLKGKTFEFDWKKIYIQESSDKQNQNQTSNQTS